MKSSPPFWRLSPAQVEVVVGPWFVFTVEDDTAEMPQAPPPRACTLKVVELLVSTPDSWLTPSEAFWHC
jgi:hypothetical protein